MHKCDYKFAFEPSNQEILHFVVDVIIGTIFIIFNYAKLFGIMGEDEF